MIRTGISKVVYQPPPKPQNIKEFLKEHPIEKLAELPDTELKMLLAPYFPDTRRAMLPIEKPKKVGVEQRAMMEAFAANKDAINALLKSKGLKV